MRLSCLQENLSRGLSIVGRAVSSRSTLPVTLNVLISTDQGRLKLSATNLEVAISTWIGVQIEEEGSVTVPARLLTEFVNSLPPERIDMDLKQEPLSLALRCARAETSISGTAAEDFPPIPSVESGVVGTIEAATLREAITKVIFAAATDESRPVLTGVKVEMGGDDFTFAAADGFRLAVYKGKMATSVPDDVEFIIPARALNEVLRLAAGRNDPVEFTVTPSKSQALFRMDNIEIVSQLVQGTFPNYSQLVPQEHQARIIVSHEQFQRAAKTAAIFARDGSGIIRLQLGGEDAERKLIISARADEVGEHEDEIDATVEVAEGESKIAFDQRYLLGVLDVMGGEVALETSTPSSPGVLKLVGSDSYVHVVMPMFVQW